MLNIQSFVNIRVLFFFILLIGLLIPTYMVWGSRERAEKVHLNKNSILSKEEKIKWWRQLDTMEEDGCSD
ncbi:hypothetical protein [Leptospira santarosai]|uniref:hypothetical protein n=1 Tax=Leptospira santarosai TaxID=28183 RepID=UPI000773E887|nr:hypothetical protein [Leptospira santarosai]ASV10543.1 hypothetical protein B2G51_00610 [Leptospira santarosai]MDO6382532.1 hypothetical protein [Leptospira santarosai]